LYYGFCYTGGFSVVAFVVGKDEVNDDAAGQEGTKKKRNRKRNKPKG